jgi:anti-sigma B factor antagonist
MISRGISQHVRLVVGMATPATAPDSDFGVRVMDGLAVVTTPEEIDAVNAELFRAAMLTAAEAGGAAIVVDMSATEFCDSTGLNVLVRALRRSEEAGTGIRLVVRAPALQRILTLTGVGGLFGNYDSLEQALQI